MVISGRRRRIDFAYPDALVAIEADSIGSHMNPEAMELDRLRDRWLQGRGWLVLRYMAKTIMSDPQSIRQELRALAMPRLRSAS